MIILINEYRRMLNKPYIGHVDDLVCGYCYEHSQAMAYENRLYHAAPYYLNGWNEAVGMTSNYAGKSKYDIMHEFIYDIFASSQPHRDIILNCGTLAYGLVIRDNAFLTIRGR